MGRLAFVPNLFLEVLELSRFSDFLDTNGWRKNMLEDSLTFGLIKNQYTDPDFLNGKVSQDIDAGGSRTIKIQDLYGIDQDGNFIYLPQVNQMPVLDDGNYYWVKVNYQETSQELAGVFSIAANGTLTATGVDLTTLFRGQPNFATRIKFLNSVGNLLEYDVLSVTDSTHAILQHPGNAIGAPSSFAPESGLTLAIVGTFTPGISVPSPDKYPFKYDYCNVQLVQETAPNIRPTYVTDREFYIARVKVNGSVVNVQDKRIEHWGTKAQFDLSDIDQAQNPLIGIEAVKYNQPYTPLDKNIMEISWGMRSANWTVDTSQNKVTFISGLGGKYKSVADFNDHDFDGWRLYAPNGSYRQVLNSVKTGGAINLTLDVLDIDDYSTDGGTTLITGTLLCVPNAEEVTILCKPYSINPTASDAQDVGITPEYIESMIKEHTFPVNTEYARIELVVNRDPACWYNVQYRYKTHKKETEYRVIPSDTIQGYMVEDNFDAMTSDLIVGPPVVYYTYDSTLPAFIKLTMNANAYKRFVNIIDRGDNFEVDDITTLASITTVTMVAGTSKVYKYIHGSFTLTNDVNFDFQSILVNPDVRDYNVFEIHFDCASLNLGGHAINFVQDFGTGGAITIKTITQGDIYEMLNRDHGIYFKFTYDAATNRWLMWQSYDLGQPNEIKMVAGDPATKFTAGVGSVKGWFGWIIFSAMAGRTPIGVGTITDGSGTYTYAYDATGGETMHQLTIAEMPSHSHSITDPGHIHTISDPGHNHVVNDPGHSHGVTDPGHAHSVSDPGHGHDLHYHYKGVGAGADIAIMASGFSDTTVGPDDPSFTSVQSHSTGVSINSSGTGVSINSSGTGVSLNASTTGISVLNHTTGISGTNSQGSNAYHNNMQPYYALTFAQKTY